MGRPPPCDAGVGTLDHHKKAATRLRWRRRRQPITRPGPPPARRSPSPVRCVGRLQGFWAEDASKRSRRGRAWRNRAAETISGPAVSHRCHAQPPAPATPAPGAPPSRTPHTPFDFYSFTSALALISSLYYTRAPQLPHASPPTRAPHIYVYSPSPVVSWSRLKSPRLFGEEVLLPYGLVTIAFRYLTSVSQFPFWY